MRLRLLVDPLAGTAAARLLTGSRWRLGAADLAALWARAGRVGRRDGRQATADVDGQLGIADALPPEQAEQAGLADALDDPGDPKNYSMDGYRRLRLLGGELAALRRRLDAPLPELVADVERTLLLDIEAMARPSRIGRVHLDAFADVVGDYAMASPSATLPALLDYLAHRREGGGRAGTGRGRRRRGPGAGADRARGKGAGVAARRVAAPGDGGLPGADGVRRTGCGRSPNCPLICAVTRPTCRRLQTGRGDDRKAVTDALELHSAEFEERRLVEDRRLFYVGLTRAQHGLFVSGHWWGEGGLKPKGPSPFLTEVARGDRATDRPSAASTSGPIRRRRTSRTRCPRR